MSSGRVVPCRWKPSEHVLNLRFSCVEGSCHDTDFIDVRHWGGGSPVQPVGREHKVQGRHMFRHFARVCLKRNPRVPFHRPVVVQRETGQRRVPVPAGRWTACCPPDIVGPDIAGGIRQVAGDDTDHVNNHLSCLLHLLERSYGCWFAASHAETQQHLSVRPHRDGHLPNLQRLLNWFPLLGEVAEAVIEQFTDPTPPPQGHEPCTRYDVQVSGLVRCCRSIPTSTCNLVEIQGRGRGQVCSVWRIVRSVAKQPVRECFTGAHDTPPF